MMWNAEQIGTVVEALRRILPTDWGLEVDYEAPARREGGCRPLDALLELRSPDGAKAVWAVEAKRSIEPSKVDVAVAQVRAYTDLPALIIASFLSEEARRRLVMQGVSYADVTGNMRLVHEHPAFFVQTEGAKRNPEREERVLQTLRGTGAGRVVRALCDFKPPYGLRELAYRASLPTGSTARVVELLEREALLTRDPKGRILTVDWAGVIRRWAQDFDVFKRQETALYLEPRGLSAVVDKLGTLEKPYAVTGSLAAASWAPIASPRLGMVYADDPAGLATKLGLRRVEANGNLILIKPSSPVPFERTSVQDGVSYAAPSQVAADLLNSPGRGPAEAEALIAWMQENPDAWRA